MAIKIGNLDISYFKVGGNDCSIYLGNTLLYPTTPPSFNGKYKFTLTDDSVVSGECDDASSAITTAETSAYTSTLKEAVIGYCNKSIGQAAFNNCTSLSSVTIPDSVIMIYDYAFDNCSSLSSITIPDSVLSIGNRSFSGCTNLITCTIGSGVTSIGASAFDTCTSLSSITIPSNVTNISNSSFKNCSGLTSITIESSTPPSIYNYAFDNTNNCPIYIPCHSRDAYTADTSWNVYSSRLVEYGC